MLSLYLWKKNSVYFLFIICLFFFLGANPSVIAFTKEKLLKAEKQMKVLDIKDAADKIVALEIVAKLVKKTKKGKKSKKIPKAT